MNRKPKNDYLLAASVLISGILVAVAIIYAVGLKTSPVSKTASLYPADDKIVAPPVSGKKFPDIGDSVVLGNPSAPITMIEYGDFQCPFCGKIFTDVEPKLRTEYIETGKVKMVYKQFAFLGEESVAAAEASECAKDFGKFWAYRDALFSAEVSDGQENNGNLNEQFFLSEADRLGIDVKTFKQCVDSKKYKDKAERDLAEGRAFGVTGTPGIFINDIFINGAQPYAAFKGAIDVLLKAM